MALPYAENACKIAIVGNHFGQETVTTAHFTQGGGWGESDLESLCERIGEWYETSITAWQTYQWGLTTIEARGLRFAGDVGIDWVPTTPINGGNVQNGDRPEQAVVLSQRTARVGRSFRGRVYIPGLPNGAVINGLVVDGVKTGLRASWRAMQQDILAGLGWTPVVISYFSGKQMRSTPVITPIREVTTPTPYPGIIRNRRVTIGS